MAGPSVAKLKEILQQMYGKSFTASVDTKSDASPHQVTFAKAPRESATAMAVLQEEQRRHRVDEMERKLLELKLKQENRQLFVRDVVDYHHIYGDRDADEKKLHDLTNVVMPQAEAAVLRVKVAELEAENATLRQALVDLVEKINQVAVAVTPQLVIVDLANMKVGDVVRVENTGVSDAF